MSNQSSKEILSDNSLRFLTVMWCDNANLIRSKSVHLPSLKLSGPELLTKIERLLTVSVALQALPAVFDEPVPAAELEPVKEVRLVPDWSTLVFPPYANGHAQVLGNLVMETEPWELCPRQLLARSMANLEESGYSAMVGAEIEFFLFRRTDDAEFPKPVDYDLYGQNSAFTESREVIDGIADALFAQGIELANYNVEAGPGQHELALHHSDPMTLANRIILARETIRAVAREHDLVVSFLPKIFADATGSGCHQHLSLWSEGKNVLADATGNWNLSAPGEAFIAGILEHLPGLMALTTPTPNSFRRIQPEAWSGAFQVWGIDNKEAAIRVLANPFGDGPVHFELKTADLSANPYVALSGILSAGADGIRRQLTLCEPLQRDPGQLTADERKYKGIQQLPESLDQALAKLKQDTVLQEMFGENYSKVYTAVRKFEQEHLREYDLEKERALLLTRY